MSLGPQCHSCRKRRIRCDSRTPGCFKCEKADIECPGYGKTFTWTGAIKGRPPAAIPVPRPGRVRSKQKEVAAKKDGRGGGKDEGYTPFVPRAKLLALPALSSREHDEMLIYETFQYWNDVVCPDLTPLPSKRNIHQINAKFWRWYPEMLQNILVCIVECHKQIRSGISRSCSAERDQVILRHRSQALKCLNERLADKSKRVETLTMSAVLMILLSEIQNSPPEIWTVHMEGSRQLIKMGGGLAKCIDEAMLPTGLVWGFVIADIMSATTSHVAMFAGEEFIRDHAEYIECLEMFHDWSGPMSWCPCPPEILHAIMLTNMLRAARFLAGDDISDGFPSATFVDASPEPYIATGEDIIERIARFSPQDWAASAVDRWTEFRASSTDGSSTDSHSSDEGDDDNNIKDWVALARSFSHAALLYFLRTILHRSDIGVLDGIPVAYDFNTKIQAHGIEHIRRQTYRALVLDLKQVIPTSLAKGVMWPLFIAGYEALHLEDECGGTFLLATKSLAKIGKDIGSKGAVDAEMLLQEVKKEMSMAEDMLGSPPLGLEQRSWDSAFTKRWLFVI